uniref:autotransporter outer membrane beta-barrel domain-containing protein n=1 Tax=Fusobacterium sp. TaxID=68766 RepID=UPI002635D6D5
IKPTPITPAKPIKSNLYVKLNNIYKGIYTSGDKNFGALNDIIVSHSFTDKDKGDYTLIKNEKMQMATLLEYLRGVYEETPYSFSNEATRKSMELFHDAVRDNNFKAKENEWLIFGGLTHENGNQEQSYYGKNYHGFDVGTVDTDVDIKLTGAYGQFEYGNSDTLSTGIIVGGNKSKIDVSSSKIKGSSAYMGVYAKKDINDFRITTGLGYQYTEYDGKRNTINQSYSEDYKDKALNLYLDGKYSYEIGKKLYLEPNLGLSYTYINQDGISENQNKALALNIDSKDFNILEGTAGINLKKVIPTKKGNHYLSTGITYKNILNGDETDYLTANYGGNNFEILIPHKNKNQISLGAKYEVELENGMFYEVKGNYFLNTDSKENSNKNSDKNEWRTGFGVGYRL